MPIDDGQRKLSLDRRLHDKSNRFNFKTENTASSIDSKELLFNLIDFREVIESKVLSAKRVI